MKKILTLVLVHQPPKLLLGMKKRGFGINRWNGFGGKVKDGETVKQAALREIQEEADIVPTSIDLRGVLSFSFEDTGEILEVYVFATSEFTGKPKESDEMRPQWFDVSEIPFTEMWPDDEHWLPLFLAGKKFIGKFDFRDTNTMLGHGVKEVLDLEIR